MADYFLAWWNLENLFDLEDTPERSDKLQRTLKKELAGWNEAVLGKKLSQLAGVINRLNDSNGPDLLGVCEVENKTVLEKLTAVIAQNGRSYEIVHHESDDGRGIDVAFLYDPQVFTPKEIFDHWIVKRTATRDLLQVNFETTAGRVLVVVANHWPSRMAGKFESEPYRIVAAETLAYYHQRILEVLGKDTAIVVMGDFNDEPFDRSLTDHALGMRDARQVTNARSPKFLNLTWALMAEGTGSHFYSGFGMLDQLLVSKGIVKKGTPFSVKPDSVRIVAFDDMKTGGYDAPRRFGRPSDTLDEDGFSDHFPVAFVLREQ